MVSDTAFLVNNMLYHFECQFSNDKEMAFRMFEYDFHLAMSDTKREKRMDEFVFPKSCVVYITTNKNNPKKLGMKIIFPTGEFLYEVPTLRVHDYSLDRISKKKLLIFLPYLVLQYPQKLKNKIPPTIGEIKIFYMKMIGVLDSAYNEGIIKQWEYNAILETIQKAEQRVFNNYPQIKEEVDSMVANTLNLQSIIMRDEFSRQLAEAEKQMVEAVEKTCLSNIEMMKRYGVTFTEDQIQEMLQHALEQQNRK